MATATTNVQLNVTGNASQQIQKVQTSVDKLGKSFSGLKTIVGGLAIGAMITNMFRAADAITDLSDSTNIAVSSITALRQAFALSGGDAEGAETALLRLNDQIQNAADGSDKTIEAFQKIGISLSDLGTLSEEALLQKTITGLAGLGNGAEAVAVKMELLGKQGRNVNFENVAKEFDTLKASAEKASPAIKDAGSIVDNLTRFKSELGGSLATQFSGPLKMLKELTDNTKVLADNIAALTKIILIFGAAWATFYKIIPALNAAMTIFAGKMTEVGGLFGLIKNGFGGIVASAGKVIERFGKLFGLIESGVGFFTQLGLILGTSLKLFLRFAGVVGIIIGVAQAIDFLVDKVLKLGSPLQWVIDKFKEFFNIDSSPIQEVNQNIQETGETAQETADRLAKLAEENKQFLSTIHDITKAYREQNAEILSTLDAQFKSLHMTEQEIANAKLHDEAVKNLNKTLDELEKKRKEALADPSKRDSGVVDQIDREIIAVRKSAQETETAAKIKTDAYYVEQEAIARRNEKLKEVMEEMDMGQYLADLNEEVRLSGLYGDELERQTKLSKIQSTLQNTLKDKAKDILELERQRQEGTLSQAAYNTELELIKKQIEMATKKAEADTAATDVIIANMERIKREQVVFDGLNSALENFVNNGKFKFKDFAASIIKELLLIEAKAALMPIFKSISSGVGGFFSSVIGSIFGGKAEGGAVAGNKPYMVGEQGPELFVPRSSGTVVPNDKLGAGSGTVNAPVTKNYITYNINAVDAKSVAQLFAENRRSLLGSVQMAQRELPYGAR